MKKRAKREDHKEVRKEKQRWPYATVKLMQGPADGREIRVRILTRQIDGGWDYSSIPKRYYALDEHDNSHEYVARTTRADDGDFIKADHAGMVFI